MDEPKKYTTLRQVNEKVLTSLRGIYTINEDGSSKEVLAIWTSPQVGQLIAEEGKNVISVISHKIEPISSRTYAATYKVRMFAMTREHLNQMIEQVFCREKLKIKKVKLSTIEVPGKNTLDGTLYIHRCKAHIETYFNL